MKISKGIPKEIYLERDYDGGYGKLFVFIIIFEDGIKGEYHSKSNVPEKFKVGEERSYSIEEKEYQGTKFNKISPYDPNAVNNRFNKKPMEDPKKQKRIVKSVAIDCAIKFALYTKTSDKLVLNNAIIKFEEWMQKDAPPTDLSITRQGILKNAVQAIQLDFLEIKTIEDVLKRADGFMGFVTKE